MSGETFLFFELFSDPLPFRGFHGHNANRKKSKTHRSVFPHHRCQLSGDCRKMTKKTLKNLSPTKINPGNNAPNMRVIRLQKWSSSSKNRWIQPRKLSGFGGGCLFLEALSTSFAPSFYFRIQSSILFFDNCAVQNRFAYSERSRSICQGSYTA